MFWVFVSRLFRILVVGMVLSRICVFVMFVCCLLMIVLCRNVVGLSVSVILVWCVGVLLVMMLVMNCDIYVFELVCSV